MTLRINRLVVTTGWAMTAALLLAGLSGCAEQTPVAAQTTSITVSPAGVKVIQPAREHLKRLSTPQPAHVEPYERTDIDAKVAGYLEVFGQVTGTDGKLRPLDIGDRVVKGQVLAKLSVPEMEQERLQKSALVDQAEAELGQTKASLAAAGSLVSAAKAKVAETQSLLAKHDAEVAFRKVEHQRYQQLFKANSVQGEIVDEKYNQLQAAQAATSAAKSTVTSAQANLKVEEARLVKARADVTSAQARLQVAKANLKHTTILLDYATIKAPYDGILTRRLVDSGSFVQSAATGKAEPLFTIVRVDRLRIVAAIPEVEAGLVKLGQTATFQPSSRARPVTGKIVRFADALDPQTRTMRTEVELDSAQAKGFRPGMFGSVTIVLADLPNAVLLPNSAFVPGNQPAVLVVEGGKALRREVELGLRDGGRTQVIRGLAGNETVIADGKLQVQDGQKIETAQ